MSSVNGHTRKPWPKDIKSEAIKLWKTKVPLSFIRKQLNMPDRTLHKILAHEKQNPGSIPDRKKSPGQRLPQEAGGKVFERERACVPNITTDVCLCD
jgi:hypothetical protein